MRIILAVILMMLPALSPAAPLWSGSGGTVQLDQALLSEVLAAGSGQFTLLISGQQFLVDVQNITGPNLGVTSLHGLVDNNPESFFLLCRTDGGATVAFLQPGDGSAYRLDHTEGFDRLHPVDYETMGSCGGAIKAESLGPNTHVESPAPQEPHSGPISSVANDGSRHDILIAYTPAAESVMGGWDFIRAEAQLAVDAANLAYANSNIGSSLRLVHVMATDYSESLAWNYEDHLIYLWGPDDGQMDTVPTMREAVGADFVSVLIDGSDFSGNVPTCGIAPVMQSDAINQGFEEYALSIVSVQCATSNWSLAHEVGHNRGCVHDRVNSSIEGAYSYSYGLQVSGSNNNDYRTVMAYDNQDGDFPRVPFFTNPAVNYNGVPTGIWPGNAGEAHNSLTHDNTSPVCAQFREERTFVEFGWAGVEPDGFILNPFPTLEDGLVGSRDGGTIVIQNDKSDFVGVLSAARSYRHSGGGSIVLGGS